jgi:hypothetical protein
LAANGFRWTRQKLGSIRHVTTTILATSDADRVAFTMGRDLTLSPPQEGGPVNFLDLPPS